MARVRCLTIVVVAAMLSACGGQDKAALPSAGSDGLAAQSALSALPGDGVQPWESVDSHGFVVGGAGISARGSGGQEWPPHRQPSVFPASSEFALGAERFLEGGNVSDNGDASTLIADGGPTTVTYAIYRFVMGGNQPGAIAVDANLGIDLYGKLSNFWIGVSDYGAGAWQWRGPFNDAQVAFTLLDSDYTSSLGNTFIAIAVYDGAQLDLVGVTVSAQDSGDATAPPALASAPQLTPLVSGIEVEWLDVIAADLAGYRVYYSYSPFAAATDNGVNSVEWLENTTRLVLPAPTSRITWVGISAVDVNGNESAMSPMASAKRLSSAVAPPLNLTLSAVSVTRGETAMLTLAGGAPAPLELLDFDLDGDGVFEITGTTATAHNVPTDSTGIIRPRVRASNADGTAVALGSVSLIVSGNQRPVANAQCTPQFGYAPLVVNMNGTGEDFDGSINEYAWDFDGDGIYDHNSPADGITAETYTAPGLYNAKLRVTDDQGAWDVDTVAVQVLAAEVRIGVMPAEVKAHEDIELTAEIYGGVTRVEWDIDGDGSYELDGGTSKTAQAEIGGAGHVNVGVRVTTSDGHTITGERRLRVRGWRLKAIAPGFGYNVTLAEVNGKPAVAFVNGSTAELTWVRAQDAEGVNWSAPAVVTAAAADSSSRMQILNVAGHPAVLFPNGADILYVRSSDDDGLAWNTVQTVVDSVSARMGSAILVQGMPALCYYENANIYYARSQTASGAAWDIATVEDLPTSLAHPRLAIVNGIPAIAYVWQGGNQISYEVAEDALGSSWNNLQAGVHGAAVHLANLLEADGKPLTLSLANNTTPTSIILSNGSDSAGSFWTFRPLLERTIGNFEAAAVNGKACYYVQNNSGLIFQQALNREGMSWGPPELVDGAYVAYQGCTGLAEVAGMPALTYVWGDGGNHYFRFAIKY